MQKIDTPDGLFHDGNPAIGELGTILRAAWLNAVQNELLAVLAEVGIAPDATKYDQLLQAVVALGNQRYLPLAGGTLTGPLWMAGVGIKQINATGDGDFEIVHRANGGISIYVDNGGKLAFRIIQDGRVLLFGAADNLRDTLQVPGTICAGSPPDHADNDQLPTTSWVNRCSLRRFTAGQPLPTSNIGPIWHDDYNSLMTWQAFNANGANYTGYASVLVGSLLADTQPTPRAGYVKSGVQNLSRTTYAALRGWAMHNGVMVALGTWAAGDIAVADNADGTTFRAYDVRAEFPRYWDDGRGVDTGRAFGSRQRGSLAVGDDGNNTAALRFDNEGLSARYGYDTPTLAQLNADYPNRMFLGVNTNTSGDGGYNTAPDYWGVSRPRNVALLAAIKF